MSDRADTAPGLPHRSGEPTDSASRRQYRQHWRRRCYLRAVSSFSWLHRWPTCRWYRCPRWYRRHSPCRTHPMHRHHCYRPRPHHRPHQCCRHLHQHRLAHHCHWHCFRPNRHLARCCRWFRCCQLRLIQNQRRPIGRNRLPCCSRRQQGSIQPPPERFSMCSVMHSCRPSQWKMIHG